jgi:hypothetical protein
LFAVAGGRVEFIKAAHGSCAFSMSGVASCLFVLIYGTSGRKYGFHQSSLFVLITSSFQIDVYKAFCHAAVSLLL